MATCRLCNPNGPLVRGDKSAQLRALDDTNVGNLNASSGKRDSLLSERIGFTEANFGTAVMVHSVLQPYKTMTARLQTVPTPRNIYVIQIVQFAPVFGLLCDTLNPRSRYSTPTNVAPGGSALPVVLPGIDGSVHQQRSQF